MQGYAQWTAERQAPGFMQWSRQNCRIAWRRGGNAPPSVPENFLGGDMRLYSAICAWIEATAFEKLAGAGAPDEPQPEGNNFANVEHAHSFSSEPELHSGWRPSDVEWESRTHISLRWHP